MVDEVRGERAVVRVDMTQVVRSSRPGPLDKSRTPRTPVLNELNVAVFGESGAGKTVLLTSFFFAHSPNAPPLPLSNSGDAGAPTFPLKIFAEDSEAGNRLLSAWYVLANKDRQSQRFPRGTGRFETWRFIVGFPEDICVLNWFDYPGGWLRVDAAETWQPGLASLMRSDVGIVIVDGQKYLKDGAPYLRRLFDRLAAQLGSLRARLPIEARLPSEWIVALSKADLFQAGYSARQFQEEVVRDTLEQLRALTAAVDGKGSFGSRFMLLSVYGPPGCSHTVPIGTCFGVTALVPAIVRANVAAKSFLQSKLAKKRLSLLERFIDWLKTIVAWVIKSNVNTTIKVALEALPTDMMFEAASNIFKAERTSAEEKAQALEALSSRILWHLDRSVNNGSYWSNQYIREPFQR